MSLSLPTLLLPYFLCQYYSSPLLSLLDFDSDHLEFVEPTQMEAAREKFTWTIRNLSKLNSSKLYSEIFIMGSCAWRILVFPKGNRGDHLSVYLDVADFANLPHGWSRDTSFKLAVINQINSKLTIIEETQHEFNARAKDWGFTSFMPLGQLHDPSQGFLVKDTCIIGAEISVCQSVNGNLLDKEICITAPPYSQANVRQLEAKPSEEEDESAQVCAEPVEQTVMSSNPTGELVDFRGLGQIEKAFVPLLEEVCLQHPLLIESQQKRSRRFTEWAFTALGRVLLFLKTTKVKDMNDITCEELQILWEELQTFRFDLTWLEPHVHAGLDMKNYLERAAQVKMLKENAVSLKMEMKRLKAKMATVEIDIEITRVELGKAEEGFEEKDVDAELGYQRPKRKEA